MKSKWQLFASIFQLIVGIDTVTSFVILGFGGENMARWIVTLVLSIAFVVLGYRLQIKQVNSNLSSAFGCTFFRFYLHLRTVCTFLRNKKTHFCLSTKVRFCCYSFLCCLICKRYVSCRGSKGKKSALCGFGSDYSSVNRNLPCATA